MNTQVNGLFPGVLEPSTTIGGCIDIYENAWENPQDTINIIEEEVKKEESEIYWERAGTEGNGPHQDIRTNRSMRITELSMITGNKVTQDVHNKFQMLLHATTPSYALRYGIQEQFFHEYYWLLRYRDGQSYKQHYDSGSTLGRCISAVCYLNDNFVGGELEFVNFKVKIKPQAGMLILFPSNYAYSHIAHPLESGSKYNLVTWIRDRSFS
jgi:hypothetical protein